MAITKIGSANIDQNESTLQGLLRNLVAGGSQAVSGAAATPQFLMGLPFAGAHALGNLGYGLISDKEPVSPSIWFEPAANTYSAVQEGLKNILPENYLQPRSGREEAAQKFIGEVLNPLRTGGLISRVGQSAAGNLAYQAAERGGLGDTAKTLIQAGTEGLYGLKNKPLIDMVKSTKSGKYQAAEILGAGLKAPESEVKKIPTILGKMQENWHNFNDATKKSLTDVTEMISNAVDFKNDASQWLQLRTSLNELSQGNLTSTAQRYIKPLRDQVNKIMELSGKEFWSNIKSGDELIRALDKAPDLISGKIKKRQVIQRLQSHWDIANANWQARKAYGEAVFSALNEDLPGMNRYLNRLDKLDPVESKKQPSIRRIGRAQT